MDKQEAMKKRAGKDDWEEVDSLVADSASRYAERKMGFNVAVEMLIKKLQNLIVESP